MPQITTAFLFIQAIHVCQPAKKLSGNISGFPASVGFFSSKTISPKATKRLFSDVASDNSLNNTILFESYCLQLLKL